MKINRCKSLFCSFKQVLKNIKNCLTSLNKNVIPEGLYRESQPLSGFTLLEVIVAIIIIGALLAFALPKYETALDKSRFSTLMPITKSIKDAEEIFYVASNQYTPDIQSLDVKTHPGETVQISVVDDDDYSYVQAIDPRIDNIYKAYLKHSTNFAEERHCEALSDSSRAKKVCETLGGTEIGESGEYMVYSLDGHWNGNLNTEKECEAPEPETTQTCSSGCGTQTRTVTCDTRTGEWEIGEFEGDCPEQGETSQSCTSGVGTETRTFSCEGDTWVPNAWDTSSCTCDPAMKPAISQKCTEGEGTETRNVTCNGTTWETGAWDTSTCVIRTVISTGEVCTVHTANANCSKTLYDDGSFEEKVCDDTDKVCETTEYNKNGIKVGESICYNRGVGYCGEELSRTYDENGNLLSQKQTCLSFEKNGTCKAYQLIRDYTYDENGNEISLGLCYSQKECEQYAHITTNTYNDEGKLIASASCDQWSDAGNCTNWYAGVGYGYDGNKVWKASCSKITDEGVCTAYQYGYIYAYDDKGNVTSETNCSVNRTTVTCSRYSARSHTDYTYDDQGNITSSRSCTGAASCDRYEKSTEYTYENGRLTSSGSCSSSHIVNNACSDYESVSYYTYESQGQGYQQSSRSCSSSLMDENGICTAYTGGRDTIYNEYGQEMAFRTCYTWDGLECKSWGIWSTPSN